MLQSHSCMDGEGGEMRQITIGDIMAILGVFALVAMVIWETWQYRYNGKINMYSGNVRAIEYNGHEYLYFINFGLTHNPDCKCMKKGE